ncbi:MAG: 4Fe-4S binding protein [Aminivibrio sp.]
MKRQNWRKALMGLAVLSLPVTMLYLSPLLTLQGAARGVVTSSLIFVILAAAIAFFAGRVFCGWICPGGAVQEILFPANDRRLGGGRADYIKYGIAAAWLGALIYLFVRAGGVKSVIPLFGIESGLSLSSGKTFVMFYIAMGGMAFLSLMLGRRPFCRYGCLLAPFMIGGRKAARAAGTPCLRLEAESEKCIHCKLCTKACPMSIDVHGLVTAGDMFSPECISCGACVDVCPKAVLTLAWGSMAKKRDGDGAAKEQL